MGHRDTASRRGRHAVRVAVITNLRCDRMGRVRHRGRHGDGHDVVDAALPGWADDGSPVWRSKWKSVQA